jgi:enoyl-CoA hydratase
VPEIKTFTHDQVLEIRLAAPSRRNALTPDLANELMDALAQVEQDLDVGAVLITAEGPSFCTGADVRLLREYSSDPLQQNAFDALGTIYRLFTRLVACPVPTIAAVQGNVVGAGINLALACDLRIVADDIQVKGFGAAGLHPGGGHFALWRSVDSQAAAWVTLMNRALDAASAVRCGFAWESVSEGELIEHALDIAKSAGSDPALTRQVTATFRATTTASATHQTAVTLERAGQLWSLRRMAKGTKPP